ncbi:MHYT domain-containing protein, partial [Streptomyces sp. NPDC101166]|uniref:MHYT domain-containing protein n=1 Tax=Streptomyces sp. NPDC101166 TaxID=3366120 RepID=UPI00380E4D09
TLRCAAIALGVVWLGLYIVVHQHGEAFALITGGTITGLGVGAMHYSGMYAMKTDAMVAYDPWVVLLSIVIAVVASIAALWFTLHVSGIVSTVSAALIMGVAVCGMHYTGMFSMHAHVAAHMHAPSGAQPAQLLTPLIIAVSMATMILLFQVGITEIDEPDLSRIRGQYASRFWPARRAGSPPMADEYPTDTFDARHRQW